ncbi:MAG: transposase [Chloroflexi bacterium]|nr:MAG: transposase [Chloroflexota bacterium]MBL1195084.1 transposase [Chloroflexota bacterium]NOH12371.1 IS200/IS605 family element transposase accessory protein TnpB [Chloroflexota bacterium]
MFHNHYKQQTAACVAGIKGVQIRKAYKFRLYPNATQQQALAVEFGHARFVYNHFLAVRREHYTQTKAGLSYADTTGRLAILKHHPAHLWLQEADSQVLQQKLKDLDRAFKNFFEGRARYPRFRSRRHRQSIRYPQRVKVDLATGRSYLPKVGWVKTVFHRSLEGRIKNVTVSRTKSGRYYASFQVELEIPDPTYRGKAVGLDLGLRAFLACSDGQKIANPRYLVQAERRLRRLQRSLSRRQKGSRGWEGQRLKVARQHEKVADQRSDFQHKLSHRLVEEHRLIAVETLHIKGMVRNRRLARRISDAGWGQFLQMLAYKGDWYGCEVVAADRWYPSSKTCSVCGVEMETMPLQVRNWNCPSCGSHHDRDVNAAKNILKHTTAGTAERRNHRLRHADGVHVRPASYQMQAGTQKSEAKYSSSW